MGSTGVVLNLQISFSMTLREILTAPIRRRAAAFKATNRACEGFVPRHREGASVHVGSLTHLMLQHNIAALWRHPTRSSDKPSPTTAL